MGIAIICYGKNASEATEKGMDIADRLCKDQHPFDYHYLPEWEDEEGKEVDFSVAFPANDPIAQKNLTEIFGYQKRDFVEALDKLRDDLKREDEALWNDGGMWRYYAYIVGQYEGSGVRVYDNDGEGVRDPEHLKNALDMWIEASKGWDKYAQGSMLANAVDRQVYVLFRGVHY